MRGLMKKDLWYIKEYGPAYLPLFLLFCLLPGVESAAYVMMLALALPWSTVANDAHCWDRFAVMLPCGAGQVVAEKYLLCGGCTAVGAAAAVLSFPVQHAVGWYLVWSGRRLVVRPSPWLVFSRDLGLLKYILILVCLTVLVIALALPFCYRFDMGKWQLGINIAVAVFLAYIPAGVFNALYRAPYAVVAGVIGVLALLAAAATFFSYRLSVHFYQRRRRGAYDK